VILEDDLEARPAARDAASTALFTPGPRMAAMPTANSRPGMLKNTSITRLIALSHAPPAYPAVSPSVPPRSIDAPMETPAT
jgi:hypothetical protein